MQRYRTNLFSRGDMRKFYVSILSFFIVFAPSLMSWALDWEPCTPKTHASVPNLKNLNYHQARERLLAEGWKPHATLTQLPSNSGIQGNLNEFWNKGYHEVEFCSGTGIA